ncbi:major facilitator superfamily domain-containing protein 12-like [Diorhabda sublineata]|uniref:major facilitator superfamily domain-containing protein 12-like n=1 Tax=Diorhabda sublineata TaxID=1163346 RepID=UPI0024E07FC1|nr:major facilitator superfamily domain-containing protein 12-like [Diorhabda sublineata]XP_056637558.1 major facilitator superfamily domain-containing protein 12-like [Diorhabda sublineata]
MDTNTPQSLINEYTEVYSRLPLKTQLIYGSGHVLNDVCASMWFTYLLVFFQYVLEFDNVQTGLLLLIGQIADAVSTPFVGYNSDKSEGSCITRYGKRKTWHLIGTGCVLGAFPFIFSSCVGCSRDRDSAELFYYAMFVIIFQFGWASVQISHLSLIPELTPNERDRTKLTAVRYSFTVMSNVLVYVIAWLVLRINESSKIGPGDELKFEHVVWSVLIVGSTCTAVFQTYISEADNGAGVDVRGGQIRSTIGDLFKTIEIYRIAVVYMSSRLFINLSQVFIPLYLHESLDMNASSLALVPLVMYVGSFVTSLLVETVNGVFGRSSTYTLGSFLGIIAAVWIKFGYGDDYSTYFIYVIAVILGAAGSIVLVTSIGITTDFIGEDTHNGAFVFGVMSFTDKLSNGLAVIVIQYFHSGISDKYFYRDVLTYICGGSVMCGAVAVLFGTCGIRRSYERIPEIVA